MGLREILAAWTAQGEATAANVREQRTHRYDEVPADWPQQLGTALENSATLGPFLRYAGMIGGNTPIVTQQDMTRTYTPNAWGRFLQRHLPEGMGPTTTSEFIPRGSMNPKVIETTADFAGAAPMSGLSFSGAKAVLGKGMPNKNVLGVNAPSVPKDHLQSTLAAINAAPQGPVGPQLSTKAQVKAWIEAGNFTPTSQIWTPEEIAKDPHLVDQFTNFVMNSPHLYKNEIDAAMAHHAAQAPTPVPTPAPTAAPAPAKIPADAQNLINQFYASGEQVGLYLGDQNKDAMITIAKNNGWNVDKLVEHYENNPIGHSDDITFTKPPSSAIHPEWKAGYDPTAPKVAAAPGTPEGEYDKIVSYFISKGNDQKAAEHFGQLVLENLEGGVKPMLEAVWKKKGVDTDLVKQWGIALKAPTPPKGYQSPFQYAGNKFGSKPKPAAAAPVPYQLPKWLQQGTGPAPLAAPPKALYVPPAPSYSDPYAGLPMSKNNWEWRDLMHYIYQEDLPVADLVGKTMDQKIPHAERLAASEELMRRVPPDWQSKLRHKQTGKQFIDLSAAGSNWESTVPTTFQGMDPLSRSNSLARKRADAISGGFNPDEMFYKTTRYPQRRFFDPATKPRSQWSFLGKKPENVQSYGNYFYPLHLSLGKNIMEKDFGGQGIGYDFDNWLHAGTADPAVTAMIARNIDDVGGVQDQWMVRHPQQHRSTYAEFDPTKFDSPNLLDVRAGGINPLMQPQEQQQDPQINPFPWLRTNQPGRARLPAWGTRG